MPRSSAAGPYALQAWIAACHARARVAEDTNWPGIVALYDALAELAPSPVVDLNRAVALGMAFGPELALEVVDGPHPGAGARWLPPAPEACAGDLLLKLGRLEEAQAEFERAARSPTTRPERRLLLERAAACAANGSSLR